MIANKCILFENVSKSYLSSGGSGISFFSGIVSKVHALSDISFSIAPGEQVAIIGANGSGKTTLLRLLAGITRPSMGRVRVAGSVATLLEVGTGLHPELSGRDNIGLAAALIGINVGRLKEREKAITDFAEIGEAIDRPVRTYSSGMRLRLGFAIAAHANADVIALDEALAVGDTSFQVRSLNRIFKLKESGKTILFVSHDLSAVQRLCSRCLVLHQGKLVFDGPTEKAIEQYRLHLFGANYLEEIFVKADNGLEIRFGKSVGLFECGKAIQIQFKLCNSETLVGKEVDFGCHINDSEGNHIHHFSNKFLGQQWRLRSDISVVELTFENHLKPGLYMASIYLSLADEPVFWLPNVIQFEVVGQLPFPYHRPEAIQAAVLVPFKMKLS